MNFFLRQSFSKRCVINLQETHISQTSNIEYQWKFGSVQSCTQNNSGGVAILYNKTYFDEIIETRSDDEGRMCSFTASKNGETFVYINIYAPNDHYKAINFFEKMESWLFEATEKHPEVKVVISGDFNFIFDHNIDSIGRNTKAQEINVSNLVKRIMTRYNLVDTYRSIHKWGGFTWGRDNPHYIRSRLDHVLVSKSKEVDIIQSYTTKLPNESDHSLIYSEFNMNELVYGPGIKRCNSDLLNCNETLARVENNIIKYIKSIPAHWNAHQKLDYIKMETRKELLKEGRKVARKEKNELDYNNQEIDLLNKEMEKLLIESNAIKNTAPSHKFEEIISRIDRIKEAILMVENENEPIKAKHANQTNTSSTFSKTDKQKCK